MKTSLITAIVFILLVFPSYAQIFPEKDGNATVYYRIVSAAIDYAGQYRCLEDIRTERSQYNFAVKPYDMNAKQQDWSFIVRSTAEETYNLYNRLNCRYVSTKIVPVNDMLTLNFESRKLSADALKFTPLGDGQYAISFLYDDEEFFLGANDQSAPTLEMPETLNNSNWAWYVYKSDDLADGIDSPVDFGPHVCVKNRCIVVSGADEWQIVDMLGRQMPKHVPLQPGLYIVTTKKLTQKIMIE